jgi:ubiquinone/menaquinone biosynthesis C-methylase UbiE
MKQGDFTLLAKDYINRTGYSVRVLKSIATYIGAYHDGFMVADIGAGTGKLTENLIEIGMRGYAVEPNDAMREEGIRLFGVSPRFTWAKGTAENTGLPDASVDWVLMASAFHWTDGHKALAEFHRILTPRGFLTTLWNPRALEQNELHRKIEKNIYEIVPDIQRVSSGSSKYTVGIEATLLAGDLFKNLIFMEAPHEVVMTKERYLGAWRSVNDIQAQAGMEKFKRIMNMIENEISNMQEVEVPYKTRAWTVQRK